MGDKFAFLEGILAQPPREAEHVIHQDRQVALAVSEQHSNRHDAERVHVAR